MYSVRGNADSRNFSDEEEYEVNGSAPEKYCNILRWLKNENKKLYDFIDKHCIEGAFYAKKNGVTFLMPEKTIIDKIIKENDANKLLSLLIDDVHDETNILGKRLRTRSREDVELKSGVKVEKCKAYSNNLVSNNWHKNDPPRANVLLLKGVNEYEDIFEHTESKRGGVSGGVDRATINAMNDVSKDGVSQDLNTNDRCTIVEALVKSIKMKHKVVNDKDLTDVEAYSQLCAAVYEWLVSKNDTSLLNAICVTGLIGYQVIPLLCLGLQDEKFREFVTYSFKNDKSTDELLKEANKGKLGLINITTDTEKAKNITKEFLNELLSLVRDKDLAGMHERADKYLNQVLSILGQEYKSGLEKLANMLNSTPNKTFLSMANLAYLNSLENNEERTNFILNITRSGSLLTVRHKGLIVGVEDICVSLRSSLTNAFLLPESLDSTIKFLPVEKCLPNSMGILDPFLHVFSILNKTS